MAVLSYIIYSILLNSPRSLWCNNSYNVFVFNNCYYLNIYTIYIFYHYIWIIMNTPCTINVLGVIIYPYFFKNKIWRAKKTFTSKMLFIKHQDPGSNIQWCMLIIYTVCITVRTTEEHQGNWKISYWKI